MDNSKGLYPSNMIAVTDLTHPGLEVYSQLSEGQLLHYWEPGLGIFIAESPKVIHRALDAGYIPISILMENTRTDGPGQTVLARCEGIPVYMADLSVLSQLTGFLLTGGMLCAMHRKKLPSVEAVCSNARRIAVLEHVTNPTNVGAIIRSAAALGIDAVLLCAGSCDPLYRRAVRVSMGTVFQIPWTYLDASPITKTQKRLSETCWSQGADLSPLQRLGFKTAAMALDQRAVSIEDPVLEKEDKLAILLGSEGDGLAPATIAQCDYTVRIPMFHGVDSLNVAAASAVAFWQLRAKNF